MINTNIIILIWPPWVWKASFIKMLKDNDWADLIYWLNEFEYVSSDKIREEIFDNKNLTFEEQMKENHTIFNILHNRVREFLDQNVSNIIIDATNLIRKNRNIFFDIQKEYNNKKWRNVDIVAYDFYTNIEQLKEWCKSRNYDREKSKFYKQFFLAFIDESVVENMIKYYQEPTYNEWFSEIHYLTNIDNNLYNRERLISNIKILLKNINTRNIEDYFKLLKTSYIYFNKMYLFKQESKYHLEDLDTHLIMIMKEIIKDFNKWLISESDKLLLLLITMFHDIWKLYTRKTRAENLISRWKIQDNENQAKFYNKDGTERIVENYLDYQFQWHEKVSWYIFEREFKQLLVKSWIINEENSNIIHSIIKEHLNFHTVNFDRDNRKEKDLSKFKYINDNIEIDIKWKFHFDKDLNINIIENPWNLYSEYIRLWLLFSKYDNLWRIVEWNVQ